MSEYICETVGVFRLRLSVNSIQSLYCKEVSPSQPLETGRWDGFEPFIRLMLSHIHFRISSWKVSVPHVPRSHTQAPPLPCRPQLRSPRVLRLYAKRITPYQPMYGHNLVFVIVPSISLLPCIMFILPSLKFYAHNKFRIDSYVLSAIHYLQKSSALQQLA